MLDGWVRLDQAGFRAVWVLLSVLWQSSVLLAAAGVLAYFLRRRRAAVRHAVWAVALLLAPLIPLLGWAASKAGTPQAQIPVVPAYSAPVLTPEPGVLASGGGGTSPEYAPVPEYVPPPEHVLPPEYVPPPQHDPTVDPVTAPAHPDQPPAAQASQSPPARMGKPFSVWAYPWALVFLAYAAGAAFFLALVMLGRIRVGRWVRAGRVATDARVLDAFWAARQRLGLRRDFVVVESPAVPGPLTIGTFHPVVLLPVGLARTMSDGELKAVATHELAHIRRHDSLLLTLLSFVRAVLYFHPLVWLACRQVSALAETACDDAVLDATGEPLSYAKMLARLAEQLPRHAVTTELAAGIVLSKGAFLRRVEAILSDRRDRFRNLSRVALAATLLAAGVSIALALTLPLGQKKDGQATSQPATRPAFDLEATAKKLAEETGLQWRVERDRGNVGPVGPIARLSAKVKTKPIDSYYVILPFPLDKEGQAKVSFYQEQVDSAKLMVLGGTENCTVLAYVDNDAQLSQRIVKALGLAPPKVTMEQIQQAHPQAGRGPASQPAATQPAREMAALEQSVLDSNDSVAAGAIQSLGRSGDLHAVAPLMARLKKVDRPWTEAWGVTGPGMQGWNKVARVTNRALAAEALGDLRAESALDLLVQGLNDADPAVAAYSAWAIGKIGSPKGVKPLVKLLELAEKAPVEGPLLYNVPWPYMGGQKGLSCVPPNSIRLDGYYVAEFAVGALVDIGPASVEELVSMKGSRRASWALGLIGDPRAVEPLIQVLKREDVVEFEAAARALGDIGDRRAADALKAAGATTDARRKVAALAALARLGDVQAKSQIEEIAKAKDSNSEECRWVQYNRWLEYVNSPKLGRPATHPATQPGTDPNARWLKVAATPKDRAGMYAAMERVDGGKGAVDKDLLQHAPPLSAKPEGMSLEEWYAIVALSARAHNPDDENFLLFRSRQLNANDLMWIERIERDGNHFTIHMKRAIWQGIYHANVTYHSVYAVNLGKLPEGIYVAEWIIEPLEFTQFDKDVWPADAKADPKDKPITLTFAFGHAPATRPATAPATQPADGNDAYRGLYTTYKALILKAAQDGNAAEVGRLTDKFNESIGDGLLQVVVSRSVGPDRWEVLINKGYPRPFALPKIKYATRGQTHVTRQKDGNTDYVLLETSSAADGTYPDGIYITMAVKPLSPATQLGETLPLATVATVMEMAARAEIVALGVIEKKRDGSHRDGDIEYDVRLEKVLKGKWDKTTLSFRSVRNGGTDHARYDEDERVLLFFARSDDQLVQLMPVVYLGDGNRSGGIRLQPAGEYIKVVANRPAGGGFPWGNELAGSDIALEKAIQEAVGSGSPSAAVYRAASGFGDNNGIRQLGDRLVGGQSYEILEVLWGNRRPGRNGFDYGVTYTPSVRERPVRKDETVLWICGRGAIKALPDTPANRQAVKDAMAKAASQPAPSTSSGPSTRSTASGPGGWSPAQERAVYSLYWLTPAKKSEYIDLLISTKPMGELAAARLDSNKPLADAEAIIVTTYAKDSIWNVDRRPFKGIQAVKGLDVDKRTLEIDGRGYSYSSATVREVIALFEKPRGTIEIHRIHAPIEGGEIIAAGLLARLKDQFEHEKRNAINVTTSPTTQPAAFDLDAAARLLTEKVGGTWEKAYKGTLLKGAVPVAGGSDSRMFAVLPVPMDRAGQNQKQIVDFAITVSAELHLLGSNDKCTVLAWSEAAESEKAKALFKALDLRPPKVTLRDLLRKEVNLQGYTDALKTRVLLGVDQHGDVKQQREFLYDSPKLENPILCVWAGTEGKLLKASGETCYIEVRRSTIDGGGSPIPPGEQLSGWLPGSKKLTVWEVLRNRTKNREQSDVSVELACSAQTVASGGELELVATFTNTSDEVRMVHLGLACLRNTATAAPLSDLGPGNKGGMTRNIEAHGTVRIAAKLTPALSKGDSAGSHQIYLLYSIRKGPEGPMPEYMVSEPVEVTLAPGGQPGATSAPATRPATSQPATQPAMSDRARERARKLAATVDRFHVNLLLQGRERREELLRLLWYVKDDPTWPAWAASRPAPLATERIAQISQDQARRIIDFLAAHGMVDSDNLLTDSVAIPQGRACVLAFGNQTDRDVSTRNPEALSLFRDLWWDPNELALLDGLRQVLDGEAAKSMDEFLRKLEMQRKEWQKAVTRPVTQPADGNIAPTPATATVLCITPKWILWQTHDLIEATTQYRAQLFTIRFYLQRRGEDRARLAWTTRNYEVRRRDATVLDDGTAALYEGMSLGWLSPTGELRAEGNSPLGYPQVDGQTMAVLAVYPDGFVMRTCPRKDEPMRGWFVPIRGGKLDSGSKVALTDERGFRTEGEDYERRVRRHGDLLAWQDGNVLNVLNLRDGNRREYGPAGQLRAFDGNTAAAEGWYYDVREERRLRCRKPYPILAVRNRIGYFLRAADRPDAAPRTKVQLTAVDLDSEQERTAILWEFVDRAAFPGAAAVDGAITARIENYVKWGYPPVLFTAEDDWLTIWDGTAWRKFKWLTRIDGPATSPATAPATQPAEVPVSKPGGFSIVGEAAVGKRQPKPR